MGLLRSSLVPSTLLIFSIPLTTFAIFTSTIAFVALFIRVLIVYVELGLVLAHNYLFVSDTPKTVRQRKRPENRIGAGHVRRRRRQESVGRYLSEQSVPRAQSTQPRAPTTIEAAGLVRDFESVGGWKFTGSAEEEAQWMAMNSRLELPAAPERKRRHRRSLTSGESPFPASSMPPREKRYGSEIFVPYQPRAGSRTPPALASSVSALDYIPSQNHSRLDQREENPSQNKSLNAVSSTSGSSASSRASSLGSHLHMRSSAPL